MNLSNAKAGIVLTAITGCLLCEAAQAQYLRQEPHWQVYTDPATFTTSVYFYDADQRLIYQEVLPGKYLKLTKNTRKLNGILSQKTSHNLIASAIPLTGIDKKNIRTPQPEIPLPVADPYAPPRSWICQALVTRQHGLMIWIDNPQQMKLSIAVYNARGVCFYTRKIWVASNRLYFDFRDLPKGTYPLAVTDSEGGTYHRNLLINRLPFQARLQPLAKEAEELATEQQPAMLFQPR
jgi:hypothetical protein